MKHISKLLGLMLATSALFFTACAKKPVRTGPDLTQTGPANSGINPEAVAVGVDPNSTLSARTDMGTPDDANKSVVEPIYFALDRYAVAQAERPKIDAAIKWLADNPGKNLVLVGHCDWRGTKEYNLGLGDHRATSVKTYLVSKGADASRLETLSNGSQDAKQGGSEADWAKDRRVDFIVLVRK
ncbi:MAG: pal [Lacunisphaera sp.]|nr:pal [Lacunisphaera sp.]